jgi:hypothetical protein
MAIDYGNGFTSDPMSGRFINASNGLNFSQEEYNKWMQDQNQAALEKQKTEEMAKQGLNADGSPIRKAFDTIANPDGTLGDKYTMNISGLDPSKWAGYSKYQNEALRTGPSAWALLQNQTQDLNTMNNKEAAARQAQSGMNAGISNLASHGGVSNSARGLAARNSTRDMLMARQNAARSGDTNKLNIATTDEGNRVGQLANLTNMENQIGQFNTTLAGKQQEYNINNMLQEQQGKRAYNDMTYTEQMKKWASDRQAQATERSSGGGGGGCCFIFLEARYGTGAMDAVVRRFRDENMTEKNKRGYYKLSEVLVPLMRKSNLVKLAVRAFMTDPLVAYGKWHYEKKGFGFLFAPLKTFWLKTFDYLGDEHKFIRENGEVI